MVAQIDPELDEVLRALAPRVPAPGPAPGVQFRRDALEAVFGQLPLVETGRISDVTIPVSGGEIPARLVWPLGDRPRGVCVWFHGGAWLAGSIGSHDAMCRIIANRSGAAVLNVGYRLAPEHPFPTGLDDANAAVRWTCAHLDLLAASGSAPVIVGGDSAGATLTATVAIQLRDAGGPAICRQVLVYPATDLRLDTPSWAEYGGAEFGLPRTEVLWSLDQYRAPTTDWRASPILADDLRGVPAATVITAECDPLRDEAEHYAQRLVAAGVPVQVHRYLGMVHGFVGLVGLTASDLALSEIAESVRASVAGAR